MAAGPSLIVQLGVSGLSNVQGALSSLQSTALKLGAALGLGFSVHKLVEGVHKVVEVGAELSILSAQTSVSVSKLIGFRVALKQAGLDAGDLGKHLRLMSKSVGEAALNGGAGAAAPAPPDEVKVERVSSATGGSCV